jgi:dipeptidyl aminopeptidase/acylaminoacyl peptidase
MIHGTYDGNTDQTGSIDTYGSVELYKQLIAVGVPAELHFLNGYGHQFDTSAGAWASVDAIPTAADLTVRFFIKEWERKLAGGTETFSPAAVSQAGASLTLTAPVATQSAPGTTYQWKKDGTSLAGQTAATLLLDPLSASDNGSYTVAVGNPNETWSKTEVSLLSFSNTPMSRVNYVKAGLKLVSSHPSSLTLAVATVAVPAPTPTPTPSPTPSFASAYPGESATSDEDGDGWVALAEYAFGWSRAQGSEGKSAIFPQTAVENQWLVLNYQVRTNDPKLVVTAETGTDLSDTNPLSWNSEGVSNSVLGPVTIGAEILERRAASVPMDAPKRFLRLRFLQDP